MTIGVISTSVKTRVYKRNVVVHSCFYRCIVPAKILHKNTLTPTILEYEILVALEYPLRNEDKNKEGGLARDYQKEMKLETREPLFEF